MMANVLFQAIDDVVCDRFPVNLHEATYLAGLRAQAVLGDYHDGIESADYRYSKEGVAGRTHTLAQPRT